MRRTLAAGGSVFGVADSCATAVSRAGLSARLTAGAEARSALSDVEMFEADRLTEPFRPSLPPRRLRLPRKLELARSFPLLGGAAGGSGVPLAASRPLTLSWSFCMISERDRSVL